MLATCSSEHLQVLFTAALYMFFPLFLPASDAVLLGSECDPSSQLIPILSTSLHFCCHILNVFFGNYYSKKASVGVELENVFVLLSLVFPFHASHPYDNNDLTRILNTMSLMFNVYTFELCICISCSLYLFDNIATPKFRLASKYVYFFT